MDRVEILKQNGLSSAPRRLQAAFWASYNARSSTARRRLPTPLADSADKVLTGLALDDGNRIEHVRRAWASVLPADLAGRCRVDRLRAGRLQVVVADASCRFVLDRQWGGELIDALSRELGKPLVRTIDYRIGRVDRREDH
jgi:hypothetical protein